MTDVDTARPAPPPVIATYQDDGSVAVDLPAGPAHFRHRPGTYGALVEALRHVSMTVAREHNRPIRVSAYRADGSLAGTLVVTPDHRYWDESAPQNAWTLPQSPPEEDPVPNPTTTAPPATADPLTSPLPETGPGKRAKPPAAAAPPVVRQRPPAPEAHRAVGQRPSFITPGPVDQPAKQGWRGAVNRVGLRVDPGTAEKSERDDIAAVSQHWPGPRTIAIANGKGSANKTPTACLLSAVFARYGGAGVLAWDNNETRGSLAWRTHQSGHRSTVLDLLPQVDRLLAATAQSAELSYFTHHQPEDKFDVLWSDQSVESDHIVSAEDVEAVYRVASRYYRLLVIDSGNSERAPNWRAMIRHADTLVVPCTNVEDTAEAAALMLEALTHRDDHSKGLARRAVAIISQRTPGRDRTMDRIVTDMRPLVHDVVRIPYDPALRTGVIRFDAMRSDTQRAWLRAAAAVATTL